MVVTFQPISFGSLPFSHYVYNWNVVAIFIPDISMQLDKLFLNFGIATSAAQLVTLFLVLLLISTVFWLLVGRFRLHNFLINTYISYALLQVIPSSGPGGFSFAKDYPIIVFLIFVIVLTLMNRYLFDIHQSGSGLAIWQVFVMSFFEVILLLSIIFSYLPAKELLKYISKDSLAYFIDPWWRFGWMVLPLAFLIFVKKREK